jgi:rhodanese-related sulfurtransferase
MKKYGLNIGLPFVILILLIVSCSNENKRVETESFVKSKTDKLYDEVFKNGNFLSASNSPKLINAVDLYSLKTNHLVLDLRSAKDYSEGHIAGSVNVKINELIDYAQAKGISQYDKVILVCYTGQTASFSAAVLQLLAYSNIYVLKWGMCSWNKKFSERWEKEVSDNGLSKISNKDFPKNDSLYQPIIKDKFYSGKEILKARLRIVSDEGFAPIAVNLNYLDAYAKKTYLISYLPEEIYKKYHLKNSIYYSPENSLNIKTDLLTLPTDKTIVVYSPDAHQSSFIAVYLKVLGYDAKTLKYGADGFMNSKMIEFGYGFKADEDVHNYPVEKSVYVEEKGGVHSGGC